MEIIEDEAIILNKQDKGANVILTLFSRNYGKINAIIYGIRKSKKREQAALMPTSISEFEFKEINGSYTVENAILKKQYKNCMKNIYKLQMSLDIVHVWSEIVTYEYGDKDLYNVNCEILEYINNLDEETLDSKFTLYIYITYLRRIMINLGIFDIDILFKNTNLLKEYDMYVKYGKNRDNIEIIDLKRILIYFERYINSYFGINIDHKKIYIE